VQVQAPVPRTLERSVELPGTLVAYAAAALYPKASGYVGEVSVDIGDHVRKGDALVRLDVPEMADELRHSRAALHTRRAELAAAQARVSLVQQSVPRATAEVQRAEAEVTLKRITAQRTEALAREQALPQQQLDEASAALAIAEGALAVARARLDELAADAEVHRAAVGVAEGNVEAAEASLARLETLSHYATVTAPFDGVITERLVDPGAFVRSAGDGGSMPVLRLAALDRLRLVVDVAEPDVPPVRPGCAAEATCGTTQVHAVVSRIAGALRPETRTMRAEIDLDNPDGQMLPGSYARVRLTLQSRDDAMMLPARAIRSAAGRTFVLVARDGRAEEAAVEVGYTDGAWTEVRSGLRDDDMVIVAAPSGVTAGSLVEAVSVEAGQGGAK
jgi:multidrug efflux pump subunit AcrA (membrane-fusion protein)